MNPWTLASILLGWLDTLGGTQISAESAITVTNGTARLTVHNDDGSTPHRYKLTIQLEQDDEKPA